MAQMGDTLAVSMAVGKIEISTQSATGYTAYSGYGFTITPSGGDRMTGEMYTHDGDVGIPTKGKRAPLQFECTGFYTEDATGPFNVLWALYIAGTDVYMRYSAKAGTTGDKKYTTDKCVITSMLPPATDPGSGDPTPFAFTLRTRQVTQATIA